MQINLKMVTAQRNQWKSWEGEKAKKKKEKEKKWTMRKKMAMSYCWKADLWRLLYTGKGKQRISFNFILIRFCQKYAMKNRLDNPKEKEISREETFIVGINIHRLRREVNKFVNFKTKCIMIVKIILYVFILWIQIYACIMYLKGIGMVVRNVSLERVEPTSSCQCSHDLTLWLLKLSALLLMLPNTHLFFVIFCLLSIPLISFFDKYF